MHLEIHHLGRPLCGSDSEVVLSESLQIFPLPDLADFVSQEALALVEFHPRPSCTVCPPMGHVNAQRGQKPLGDTIDGIRRQGFVRGLEAQNEGTARGPHAHGALHISPNQMPRADQNESVQP